MANFLDVQVYRNHSQGTGLVELAGEEDPDKIDQLHLNLVVNQT